MLQVSDAEIYIVTRLPPFYHRTFSKLSARKRGKRRDWLPLAQAALIITIAHGLFWRTTESRIVQLFLPTKKVCRILTPRDAVSATLSLLACQLSLLLLSLL